jgi:hypothetical protein
MSRPTDAVPDAVAGVPGKSLTDAAAAAAGSDPEYRRADEWRNATRDLVLAGATVIAAARQSHTATGTISVAVTGKALISDLLLADSGDIVLEPHADSADATTHEMTVVPMRLDMLADLPAIRVRATGVSEPTQLRLIVELTVRNPHTDATSRMTCEYESVRLDTLTSVALLDFQLQHGGGRIDAAPLDT